MSAPQSVPNIGMSLATKGILLMVLAMFFIIYALNVIADALRDALDPKLND